MDIYREKDNIGNDYIPIELLKLKISKGAGTFLEIFSGLGNEFRNNSRLDKDRNFITHWHSYFEILYFIEGYGEIQINDQYIKISTGDIVMINAYDIHNVLGKCKYWTLLIDPTPIVQLRENLTEIFPINLDAKIITANNIENNWIRNIIIDSIKNIYKLYVEKPIEYSLVIMSKLYAMLAGIQKYSYFKNLNTNSTTNKEALLKINNVFDYISKHYSEEISLQDIAKSINYSPPYFSKFFKKHMGKPFNEYLNSYRCLKAEALLHSTAKSITDIALDVGFESVSYFDKVYKKIKGYKPSDERKNLKKSPQ